MMNCCSKEQIGRIGRNQTELLHICPSKLSRRELEDLYFALLQNNLDLKKTINRQSEKVKVLSTKLQRMTATQKTYAKDQKGHRDVSAGTKNVVHDQNLVIADLKKANERLTERIRQLNMRLCSAKQYLRSQPQLAYGKIRPASSKPSSTSALIFKKSGDILNMKNVSVSCQCLDREEKATKTIGTETNEHEKEAPGISCDANACKTLMEELKQKIIDLQEELAKNHDEYSTRISRLECEVSDLHGENLRVRNDQSQRERDVDVITARLRDAEAKCEDINAFLLIEKGKVAELETQMKAAGLSNHVAKTIEDHLNRLSANKLNAEEKENFPVRRESSAQSDQSPKKVTQDRQTECDGYLFKNNKTSDDSGYTDPDRDSNKEDISKINEKLMHRINELQSQLEALKMNATAKPAGEAKEQGKRKESYSVEIPYADVPILKNINDYKAVLVDPDKKVLLKIEHVNRQDGADVNNQNGGDKNLEKKKRLSSREKGLVEANRRWAGYDSEGNGLVPPDDDYLSKTEKLSDDTNKTPNVTKKDTEKDFNQELKQKASRKKSDSHNRCQIPGPLPVDSYKKSLRSCKSSKAVKTKETPKDFNAILGDESDSDMDRMQKDFKLNRLLSSSRSDENNDLELRPWSANCKSGSRRASQKEYETMGQIDSDEENNKQELKYELEERFKQQTVQQNRRSSDIDNAFLRDNSLEKPVPNDVEKEVLHKNLYLDNAPKESLKNVVEEGKYTTEYADPVGSRRPSMHSRRNSKEKSPLVDLKVKDLDAESFISTMDPMQHNQTSKYADEVQIKSESQKAAIVRKIENKSSDPSLASSLSFYTRKTIHRRLSDSGNKKIYDSIDDKQSLVMPQTTAKNNVINGARKSLMTACDDGSSKIELKSTVIEQTTSYDDVVNVMDSAKGLEKSMGGGPVRMNTTDVSSDLDRRFDDQSLFVPLSFPVTSTPVQTDRNEKKMADGVHEKAQISLENNTLETEQLDICSTHAHVCTCPPVTRRDVCVFRSCSGTLRFRTKCSNPQGLRRCKCGVTAAADKSCGTQVDMKEGSQSRRNSATYNQPTYTLIGAVDVIKFSRGTSPENTDHEISSLSDLPEERDGCTSQRQSLSPGEHKETSTLTDSGTAPSAEDCVTLSEGELPHLTTGKRLSVGEKQPEVSDAKSVSRMTSSQKMEAALEAIGEELARCRHLLLQSQRSKEKPSQRDASAMIEACPSPISLRKSEGKPRIGDTFTAKCVFTLHIGTAVLSDEAVINSRSLSLMLSWQFYDQSLSMTRMKAGRVIHFDFSTEYEIKLNDDFLNYMQSEDMALLICEMDKQDEPFASCILPLRDALVHSNRRVDMSVALLTGPRMLHPQQSVLSLHAGEELGVLDLWYTLRVDPRLLPRINKTFTEKHSSFVDNNLRPSLTDSFMLTLDSDNKFDKVQWEQKKFLQSRKNTEGEYEFDLNLGNYTTPKKPFIEHPIKRDEYKLSNESKRGMASIDKTSHENVVKNQVNFDEKWAKGIGTQRASGIIMNEVPVNIRSANEMRKALKRTYVDPSNKKQWENSIYQNTSQPSLMSVRSLIGRRPKDRQKLSLSNAKLSNTSNMYELMDTGNWRVPDQVRKSMEPSKINVHADLFRKSIDPSKININADDSDATLISKKYDNMSKMIGAKKALDIFKRVKIRNKSKLDETPSILEPVTDDLQDYEKPNEYLDRIRSQSIDITILWLALNEECEAMVNPNVQRLYVTYTFLGRNGAELETPISQPKPKQYVDKCFFYCKKTFQLNDYDLPILGRLAHCRSSTKNTSNNKDGPVFTVVSEPAEDPLLLNNCEDIGYAQLYFGDLLAYSAGSDSYTEVIPIRSAMAKDVVVGVLAVKVDGLDVVRKCLMMTQNDSYQPGISFW